MALAEAVVEIIADIGKFDADLRKKLLASVKRAEKDIGRRFESIGRAAARVGRAISRGLAVTAALSLLSAGLAQAASSALAFAAALAPALGIVAALPAAAGLAGAAFATLSVALSGVGDAFTAALGDDAKKFEESLKGLAPQAAAVARELRGLKPRLDAIRSSVQGALFAPLQGELTRLVATLRGPVRAGMTATAGQLGRLAAAVARFARSSAGVRLVGDVFASLRGTLAGIRSDTVERLLTAVSRFVSATLPAFDGLGAGIDGAANRLAAFLEEAAASGDALRWVQDALQVFRALGGIAADVAGIIAGIFRAVQGEGGGALGTLGALLDRFNAFVNSAAGQTAIGQIFSTLAKVGAEFGDVLAALLVGLGELGPTLGEIAQVAGPVLVTAIRALVPALQELGPGVIDVFEALGQAVTQLAESGQLTELGRALAGVLTAIAPLLPGLAALVVSGLGSLVSTLETVTPLVAGLASAFDSVAQSPVGSALGPLVAQFLLVSTLAGSVAAGLRAVGATLSFILRPILAVVGAFARVRNAALVIISIVTRIAEFLRPVIAVFARLAPIARVVGQVLFAIGRVVLGLVAGLNPVTAAVLAVVGVLALLYTTVQPVRDAVDGLVSTVVDFGARLVSAFQAGGLSGALAVVGETILSALSGIGSAIVSFVAGIPGQLASLGSSILAAIGSALAALPGQIATLIGNVIVFLANLPVRAFEALLQFGPQVLRAIAQGLGQVLAFIGRFVADLLVFFITLPIRIGVILLRVGVFLFNAFRSAFVRARAAVVAGITAVVTFFQALPGRILAFLVALPGQLRSLGARALTFLVTAVRTGATAVLAFMRALPGRVIAAVTALPGLLRSLGARALTFLVNAVRTGATRVISFFRELPGRVVSALSGFATAMFNLGRDIILGLVNGIKAFAGRIIDGVRSTVSGAINEAKALLGIGSPSKVFAEIGRDINRGFVIGLTSSRGKVTQAAVDLARDIVAIGRTVGIGFVKAITGSTSKIDSTLTGLQKRISKAFEGISTRIDNQLIATIGRTNTRLQALARRRDAIADQIKAANEKASEVTRGALDFAAVTGLDLEDGQDTSATAIAAALKARLNRIRDFQADLARLASRGLDRNLIAQLVAGGPEQSGQLARTLAGSTREVLAEINATQAEIAKSATDLGQSTADLLFDSGRAAGKGFLAGLKDQQVEIVKLMERIAKAVAETVKRTLKISSPSKVFDQLGSDTLAGYLRGIDRLVPQVRRSLASAVSPATAGLAGTGLRGTTAAASAATTRQTIRQTTVNNTNVFNQVIADPNAIISVIEGRLVSAIR